MTLKCSECGGEIQTKKINSQTIYKCIKCGREKLIKQKIIDMSESANLEVIME